jgi:hypothetical protein
MKHMVATCAHLLVAPQWRLVHTELDASAELKVAHDRQADGSRADGSRHGGRHEEWARVHDARHKACDMRWQAHPSRPLAQGARHEASASFPSFGARALDARHKGRRVHPVL